MRVPRKHHRKDSVGGQQSALSRTQKPKGHERLLPFVTTCHQTVKKLNHNIDETLESDTQSALAENNFYKTSDHLLQIGKIPQNICL